MSFASQSQGHHGAAVEGVFKGDDAGALGVGAGDLDGVFDGFCTGVDEEVFLAKLPGVTSFMRSASVT